MANKIDTGAEIVAARAPARPGEIRAAEVIKRLGISHQRLYQKDMLELLNPRVAYTATRYFDAQHVDRIAAERAAVSGALTATAVGKLLGISAVMVRALDRYLVPTLITVGKRTVRTYDPARVQRCKEIRDQAAARGDLKVPHGAYSVLLTVETSAPTSEGMSPTLVGPLAGDRPKQVTRPKSGKASRIGEATRAIKEAAVSAADRKRTK